MRQIKRALASLPLSHFDQHLFWAAFTLAYFGFLRVGELVPDSGSQASVSLSHSDVPDRNDGSDPPHFIWQNRPVPSRGERAPGRHWNKLVPGPHRVRLPGIPSCLFAQISLSLASVRNPSNAQPVRGHTLKMPERSRCVFRPAILSSQLPYWSHHHCSHERGPRVAHPGLRPLVQRLLPASTPVRNRPNLIKSLAPWLWTSRFASLNSLSA